MGSPGYGAHLHVSNPASTPFSQIYRHLLDRASDRLQRKKSNFTGFSGTNSQKNHLISRVFLG